MPYAESSKIARGKGDLNNLGVVFSGWGQYDKAVDYYEKSLAISRELKDRMGEGFTLNNLGNDLLPEARIEGPWQIFSKALNIYQEIGLPRLADQGRDRKCLPGYG